MMVFLNMNELRLSLLSWTLNMSSKMNSDLRSLIRPWISTQFLGILESKSMEKSSSRSGVLVSGLLKERNMTFRSFLTLCWSWKENPVLYRTKAWTVLSDLKGC